MELARDILNVAGVYAGIGVLFALAFVLVGVSRVDHAARESGFLFRLLIVPGAAALWPLMLWKWIRAGQEEHG